MIVWVFVQFWTVCLRVQERIWGSTLEQVLYLSNVSSSDNLHNLTCEAENQAGPDSDMVQLDIECKCVSKYSSSPVKLP